MCDIITERRIAMKKLVSAFLVAVIFCSGVSFNTCIAQAATAKTGGVTVTLSKTSYTYNGEQKTPKVTVKNKKGKVIKKAKNTYTVSYPQRRTLPGTYTVKVVFKGKYKKYGTVKKKYNIKAPPTSFSGVSYSYNALTVKWKKPYRSDGYEIKISTDKEFKKKNTRNIKVNDGKKTSYKIQGLLNNKKYYVKIRSVFYVNAKSIYYSSWSKAKTYTTKKVTYNTLISGKLRVDAKGHYQIKNINNEWEDAYYCYVFDNSDWHQRIHDLGFDTDAYSNRIIDSKGEKATNEYYRLLYKTYQTLNIPSSYTDLEKYMVISRWFNENLQYSKGKNFNENNYKYADDGLKYGYTVCGGFAALTYDLCDWYGIPCEYFANGLHAWNAVKLNRYWYQNDMNGGMANEPEGRLYNPVIENMPTWMYDKKTSSDISGVDYFIDYWFFFWQSEQYGIDAKGQMYYLPEKDRKVWDNCKPQGTHETAKTLYPKMEAAYYVAKNHSFK